MFLSLHCNQNIKQMNSPIETKTIGKYKIEIFPDDDPMNPREDDNLGTMICFHNRYTLGDKHNYDHNDYEGWAEMKQALIKEEKLGVILPLFLYDHSGLTISTTPFSCPWDSGRIGFIFISKQKMREEYGYKRISQKLIKRVAQYLVNEVEVYDQYLRGDCYGYRITDTTDGEEVDSCWGYYGDDYCMAEAEGVVNSIIERETEKV